MPAHEVQQNAKPSGRYVGHNRDEAIAALEAEQAKGNVAWLEDDTQQSMSNPNVQEWMGYSLYVVECEISEAVVARVIKAAFEGTGAQTLHKGLVFDLSEPNAEFVRITTDYVNKGGTDDVAE